MSKSKATRSRKFSPERPLVVQGQVPAVETVPGRWAWAAGPLDAVAAWVPATKGTRAGERFRRAWKIGFGAVAVLFASYARQDLGWVVPSLLAVALAVLLPISDIRRARWRRAAQGLAAGRQVSQPAAAEVTWDGTRLMVRAEARQFSVRPAEAAAAVGRDDQGAWLALAPGGRGKQALAFRAAAVDRPLPSRPCPASPDRVVTVAAPDWDELTQALAPRV